MSDLPRLLLCVFDVVPAPTAISRRLTEYLKGLSERYQVVVLSVKTPDHTHIERYHGARLLRVPVGSGDLAARVQSFDRAVRRQLESEEYVMVHSFDPFGGYALCERRSELGYKVIYDACSLPSVDLPFLYSEEEANRRFIARVRRQELFCLMNADMVIVANELTREFVTGLGVARDQVQVLPAPVDLAPYAPEVMGVPDATPMKLLHLGHQGDAQDLATLMEAMQLALQTVDVRLAIVGPKHEAHQARLEEQVAALKLTGKVEFQPPVVHDDLHKVLATADVGLLTLSDVERNSRVGSPLARLGEYLAAGRPVIAADVPAARALLPDDGVVLYRPQDPVSLADAIVSLATEPTRRVKLGIAARAASLDRDAAKVRADLVAIYVGLSGTGVRAVGDADAANPDEVTQLGRSLSDDDTQRKKAAQRESPSGTNKVRTDPNIAADETSPEAAMGSRPAVMGTPLRDDEPPVVVGEEVQALAAELGHVTTEPNARRPTEPPVVMGMPLPVATKANPLAPTHADLADELGEIESASSKPTPAPIEETSTMEPVLDAPPVQTNRRRGFDPLPERTLRAASFDPLPERASGVDEDEPLHVENTTKGAQFSPLPERSLTPIDVVGPPVLESSPTLFDTPTPSILERSPAPIATAAPPILESSPTLFDTAAVLERSSAPFATATREVPDAPIEKTPVVVGTNVVGQTTRSENFTRPQTPPTLDFVPLGVAVSESSDDDAPFADDADLAPVRGTPAKGLTAAKPMPDDEPPFADDSDLAPPIADDDAPFVDDADLSHVTGLTPALGLPAVPRPPPLVIPPLRTASGVFAQLATAPTAPSRADGYVPLLTPPGALPPPRTAPPPLPRTTSGVFAVLSSTPSATGLFPEPPKIPAKPKAEPLPPPVPDDLANAPDEPLAMAAEEAVMTVDTDSAPPPSAIDPWLAQLVHGYCPPQSGLFERHTPPTTMPGRDT